VAVLARPVSPIRFSSTGVTARRGANSDEVYRKFFIRLLFNFTIAVTGEALYTQGWSELATHTGERQNVV